MLFFWLQSPLQQFQCDGGAGFGIGQGVMMVHEVIAAGGCHCLQLVVWETMPEVPAGGGEGVLEFVVGVVHLIYAERGLQATLVEAGVVCHQGKALDEWGNFLPHIGEHGCSVGIVRT